MGLQIAERKKRTHAEVRVAEGKRTCRNGHMPDFYSQRPSETDSEAFTGTVISVSRENRPIVLGPIMPARSKGKIVKEAGSMSSVFEEAGSVGLS